MLTVYRMSIICLTKIYIKCRVHYDIYEFCLTSFFPCQFKDDCNTGTPLDTRWLDRTCCEWGIACGEGKNTAVDLVYILQGIGAVLGRERVHERCVPNQGLGRGEVGLRREWQGHEKALLSTRHLGLARHAASSVTHIAPDLQKDEQCLSPVGTCSTRIDSAIHKISQTFPSLPHPSLLQTTEL